MIIVQGEVRLDPADMEAFRAAAHGVISATRAEAGCLAYSYAEDVLAPGLIHVVERWETQEACDAHMASAHLVDFLKVLAGLRVLSVSITAYEAGDARALMG